MCRVNRVFPGLGSHEKFLRSLRGRIQWNPLEALLVLGAFSQVAGRHWGHYDPKLFTEPHVLRLHVIKMQVLLGNLLIGHTAHWSPTAFSLTRGELHTEEPTTDWTTTPPQLSLVAFPLSPADPQSLGPQTDLGEGGYLRRLHRSLTQLKPHGVW